MSFNESDCNLNLSTESIIHDNYNFYWHLSVTNCIWNQVLKLHAHISPIGLYMAEVR